MTGLWAMYIGNARVLTTDQTLEPHTGALSKAGCEELITSVDGGARVQRPGLEKAISFFCRSDTLVIRNLY